MDYNFDVINDRYGSNAAKYEEMQKKFGRNDLIPLWVADMDFQTAQPIIDAMALRANRGIYGYTTRPDGYFEAVRDWQVRRHGWRFDPELAGYCHGVVPALSVCVYCFSRPGDRILIQTPVYTEFFDVIRAWDREVLENPLVRDETGRFEMDFVDLEEKLKLGPKLMILCSPHNPVGRVWTREELSAVAELCEKYGVMVVSDEIHSDLVQPGFRHLPMAAMSEASARNTITCISATKTFNLAGLQVATVVFPHREAKEDFEHFWLGLDLKRNNCFSVVAMEAAYEQGEEWLEQLLAYLAGNISYVCGFIANEIPGIAVRPPEATYLLWLDCGGLGLRGDELTRFMVEEAGLALNEGRAYAPQLDGFMRLNAACPRAVLEQAMKQLKAAVDKRWNRERVGERVF